MRTALIALFTLATLAGCAPPLEKNFRLANATALTEQGWKPGTGFLATPGDPTYSLICDSASCGGEGLLAGKVIYSHKTIADVTRRAGGTPGTPMTPAMWQRFASLYLAGKGDQITTVGATTQWAWFRSQATFSRNGAPAYRVTYFSLSNNIAYYFMGVARSRAQAEKNLAIAMRGHEGPGRPPL